MDTMRKIDLHMHSTVSDGTDMPVELLERVRQAGLELFALTDHDTIKGHRIILDARTEDDPKVLSGVEFSCKDSSCASKCSISEKLNRSRSETGFPIRPHFRHEAKHRPCRPCA